MPNPKGIPALTRLLTKIHRELGIPSSYAVDRRLAPHLEALESELVEVGINDEGRPIRLIQPAAKAWATMRLAASRHDLELVPISGFRSIARQAEIVRAKLQTGQSLSEILQYVAAPGFSEHHTGRAVDIGSSERSELDEAFAHTAEFRWLEKHASDFGFTLTYPRENPQGFGYEPWHWYWSPVKG